MQVDYSRRHSSAARVGHVTVGGLAPVAVQSMTNTPTLDVEASAAQCLRIARAGADIVRLTAQTPVHARKLGEIRRLVREAGCDIPLVADIHFNPAAAFAAAEEVEKVRINPGNFADPGRTFVKIDFTDEEYAAELERIREKFSPLLALCRERGTALRIGVNHGSLSDRIMSRYGDTPAGMVESAMEFLRICRDEDFTDVVISIKASNVTVMTATVRLLVEAMVREDMHFPLHLGVTEAGDGEDARIKSAVGIGSLLADGIGDTIRVSLTEDPEREVPVAQMLLRHIASRAESPTGSSAEVSSRPLSPEPPLVVGLDCETAPGDYVQLTAAHPNIIGKVRAAAADVAAGKRIAVRAEYPAEMSADEVRIAASVDLGSLLLSGLADAVEIVAPALSRREANNLALGILQATRRRITHTEYIACPGCGRTLFELQRVLAEVKAATSGLTGLKIGVMGCIVNGPGEMADADYGYVGAGPGRVSLYKGKQCVVKNIPSDEALLRLIQLIKDNGDWPDETA